MTYIIKEYKRIISCVVVFRNELNPSKQTITLATIPSLIFEYKLFWICRKSKIENFDRFI